MPASEDFYLVLGLTAAADQAEIRRAYLRLAMEHHPDKNPEDPFAAERFRKIHDAYVVLSDISKRKAYDEIPRVFTSKVQVSPYLDLQIENSIIQLNEELEISFSFPADGRFFQRSKMKGWELCYGPLISQEQVTKDGVGFKESRLHYIIAPLHSGELLIEPARIFFEHKAHYSTPATIQVQPTRCAFNKKQSAGSQPMRVYLHKEQVTSHSAYRKTRILERVVLIPRSDLAAWYHRIGRMMKTVTPVCGCAWALATGHSLLLFTIGGTLLAGANCHIMYKLVGMKSQAALRFKHPSVQSLLEKGFKRGKSSSLIGEKWQVLIRWVW